MTNYIIGGSCHKSQTRDRCVFVATKPVFCRDKTMLVATNTSFVGTKPVFCRDKTMLVATNTSFVGTKPVFCRDKTMLTATQLFQELPQVSFLSRKSKSNICCDKHNFVATEVLLRQAYFCRYKIAFCCYKTFVATKIILAAAFANDIKWEGGLYARVDGSLYVHVDFDTQFQEVRIFSHFTVQMCCSIKSRCDLLRVCIRSQFTTD